MGLSLKKLSSGIRDIFDANTQADQQRRMAAGQPQYYQQQQAQRAVAPVAVAAFGGNNQFVGTPKSSPSPVVSKPSVAWNAPTQKVVLPQINNNVQVGVPQPIPQLGNKQITQSKPMNQMTAEDWKKDQVSRQIRSTTLGVGRSLTGTVQSLSGLVDTVSPGKGQSQFTKNLNRNAEGIDAEVKSKDLNNALYKTGQIGTDVATFLVPGVMGGKAVAKGIGYAGMVPGAGKAAVGFANIADKIAKSGKVGKAAVGTGKYLTKPSNVANITTDTALNTGFRGARDQDVSPGTVALDSSMSAGTAGLLTGTGKSAKWAVNKVADKLISDDVLKPKTLDGLVSDNYQQPTTNKSTTKTHASKPEKLAEPPKTDRMLSVDEAAGELRAAQAAKEADVMKYKGIEKIRAKGRQVSERIFNPYAEGERFTSKLAKAMGISTKKINARQDLAHLLDVVSNSGTATAELADRTGLGKVISKYPPGSDEEARFITYLMAKRDLDVRANKGVKILPYDDAQVKAIVDEYEAMNTQALQDLATVNNHFKVLLKDALDSKTITKADYDKALSTEDFYAPVARVTGSEDVLRPTINANVKGSLNKQHAIQSLTGSDLPVNTTWDAIVGGTQKIIRENARNRAFNLMYSAADQGFVDDMVRMGMSKEESSALLGLRDLINDLQRTAGELNKTTKSTSKKLKVTSKKATAYNNKVQDSAIKKMATLMESRDPDGAAALRGLSRSDQKQLLDWIQSGMTDNQVARQTKLNQQTQDVYRNLMGLRASAENLVAETGAAKRGASELQSLKDGKSGKQVLSGFVDGYPVWIETTPEMAKMIQGLEPQDLGKVTKFVGDVNHIWRTFWTGLFNPVFAVKSKLFYDQPMLFLNQSGSRNQLRPTVMAGALGDNFTDVGGFFNKLKQEGVAPVTGSRVIGDTKQTAQLLAAHNDFQSKLGYYARHPKAALEALDVVGGKLAHGSRMQAARAEYKKALAQGLSEADALANSARAYNNVLPNYGRTTKTLRAIDAWIPYANAGIAGTRSMTGAVQKDPVGWSVKAGTFATALAAAGTYSMTDDTTKAFYQDMYDTNQQSVLQNNIVIALPGASKDPETGEWTGIIKVPIPPEFRAPNALIQDAAFKNIDKIADTKPGDATVGGTQEAYNPAPGAITSMLTGGIVSIGRGGGLNVETNPGATALLELGTNKKNTGMGDPFAYGDTKYLPRNEQANKDTSQAAISAANLFNKLSPGDKLDISPAALDEQFKSFGIGGKAARSVASGLLANENTTEDQLPKVGFTDSIKGTVVASNKGMTDTKWHFKNQEAVKGTLPTQAFRDQFSILNSKNDSPGDSQAKSQLLYESLQGDGTIWNAQKKQNEMDAKNSGISNPLFGLTPEQARAVTLYRGNARMTAAKQSYAKDGSSLFQSLGLDNKWYQDFKKKENDFYAAIEKKKKDPSAASMATAAKTYSGNAYTEPSVVMQSKLDAYYAYPAKSAERRAYLKANPDIVQYWDQQNGLANEERLAMGLDLLEADKYGSKGYGSSGGGGVSNNPYKYAISTSSGGGKPKIIKAKKAAKVGIAAKSTAGKPKVTIKKSMV